MKLLALCSLLFPYVLSTSFPSSAVITSQDVTDGLTESKMALTPGQKYRVYAVYDSSRDTDSYALHVVIKGADNSQFTVATLATPKLNTGYVLDETKILTAPITITDTNPTPTTGFAARVPFTIYIVSTDKAVSPVISAQLVDGPVNSKAANLNAPSCTILSAEMDFQLSSIDTGSLDKIEVTTAGFDSVTADNTVLTVTKDSSVGSSVMISGPIATLRNPNGQNGNFSFVVKKDGVWSGSLTTGSSTAFLSNGWLSVGESYNMAYQNDYVRYRSYDFGRETQVSFSPVVGNYFPPGDSITFTCGKTDGKGIIYDCGERAGSVTTDWCKSISLTVSSNGKTTISGPRFMVKVESGAVTNSMFVLLIASVFGVLFR